MTNNQVAPIGFKRAAGVVVLAALAGVLVDALGQEFLPGGLVHVLSISAMLAVVVVGFPNRYMSWRDGLLVALCSAALAVGFVWLLSILRF